MSASATGDGGQSLTVHQLLRQLAPDYRKRFGASMPGRHRQVLQQILSCRTPALGGQLFQCPDCPGFAYRFHSCNDRHCPLCGQTDAAAWLEHFGSSACPNATFVANRTALPRHRMLPPPQSSKAIVERVQAG